MFDDIKSEEMPEDLETAFINGLRNVLFNVDNDKDLKEFCNGFFDKHGHEIYEYHLKTFTKEELWQTILISTSKKFQKMVKFQLDCQEFVGNLANSYMDELYKQEYLKESNENSDEWST